MFCLQSNVAKLGELLGSAMAARTAGERA